MKPSDFAGLGEGLKVKSHVANTFTGLAFLLFSFLASPPLFADSSLPAITNISVSGTQKVIQWTPFPGVKSYKILSTTNFADPFITNVGGISGYQWMGTNSDPFNFFQLQITPQDSNEVLTANVLNRISYGPTPDELERILNGQNPIGPAGYIAEQLAFENIDETVTNSHTNVNRILAKLALPTDVIPSNTNYATMDDYRALHILRAVGAKRQLLEILLQFFENHFVTQYTKSVDYFDQFYDDSSTETRISASFEYLENNRWREALMNPSCTFYDLLRISAESPAMIIYLDTVTSKGNSGNIANENYARELFELFTFGVDNGYAQDDIVNMSRSWTGWSVQIVSPTEVSNPFIKRTTNLLASSIAVNATNVNTVSNLAGVWSFNYVTNNHDVTRAKGLFTNYFIPARFGAPYTTKTYGTNSVPGRYTFGLPTSRPGTNGIQDGYAIIAYLADMPFTQEHISIKLCRLFVHDDFPNPSNDTNNPAYQFYNYAAGNLSPEAQLVRDCMTAWESSSPQGQLRPVLETIFNSELFRTQASAMQKVKTPLEYTVSAIRALRSSTNGTFQPGTYSADTDGYDLIAGINRMGSMSLFDRVAPDGYPEDAAYWISAGTLAERIRFVQSYMMITNQTSYTPAEKRTAGLNTLCYPASLINTKFSTTDRTNATAVADYFVNIIFPGEGAGNLSLYRDAAVNFLNDGSADVTANNNKFGSASVPFSATPTSPYDIRVRGMISYLLSLQRFQEQ